MVRTVVVQLILFLLPFLAYAIYRLLVSDAEQEGRKTWPITILFAAGAVLFLAGWVAMWLSDDKDPNMCFEPGYERPRFVDGEIVPARQIPCERDLRDVGAPASETPSLPPAEGASNPVGPVPGPADPQIVTPEDEDPELKPADETAEPDPADER